jgi:hypothetical protein
MQSPPASTRPSTPTNTPERQRARSSGEQDENEDETQRQKPQRVWTLYRVAVVVSAPSGRRLNLDTYRLGQAR